MKRVRHWVVLAGLIAVGATALYLAYHAMQPLDRASIDPATNAPTPMTNGHADTPSRSASNRASVSENETVDKQALIEALENVASTAALQPVNPPAMDDAGDNPLFDDPKVQEAVAALKEGEVNRFVKLMHERGYDALELFYRKEWLRMCLEDPRARKAYTEFLLNGVDSWDNPYLSARAMDGTGESAPPSYYEEVMRRAIQEGKWSLAAGGLKAAADHTDLPADTIMTLARESMNAANQEVYHNAARMLLNQMHKLSPEQQQEATRMLQDLYWRADEYPGTRSVIFTALDNEGAIDVQTEMTMVEVMFENEDPTARFWQVATWARSTERQDFFQQPIDGGAPQVELMSQVLTFEANTFLSLLEDPSPGVRTAAALELRSVLDSYTGIINRLQQANAAEAGTGAGE